MKHHFGDMLDRTGGHWTIVPNRERYAYQAGKWSEDHKRISIATISRDDDQWQVIGTFPNLEELTLHSPSREQLAFVSQLRRLKRLRITHARPKDINFLSRLDDLEEVVLEYVSGFEDLSPIGRLPRLTALHLENLRQVSDFSPLGSAAELKYLGIRGTLDWAQPVESFDFLSDNSNLEYLVIGSIRPPKGERPLASLEGLEKIKKINIAMSSFPLEVFAWLEARRPEVEGATRPAFVRFGGENREINRRDVRYRMPKEEFERHANLFVGNDGKRYHWVPHQAALLGKGQRGLTGKQEAVDKACMAHEEKYRTMVQEFRDSDE